MQSAAIGNRFIIGIVAFGVSFGLSLFLSWDFNKALLTGIITVPATYLAALFVDRRQRSYEMLVLDSLHRRIRELELLKGHMVQEISQLQAHKALLHAEFKNVQNQITDRRYQRDSLNRELSTFVVERKQLEVDINYLRTELHSLEKNKVELNKSHSSLTAEKRRLDLNCNLSRAEISQLQTQICELQQQKQELENNLTLLNRLKPQLEEKLYELRVQTHELELQQNNQNKLLLDKAAERENIEARVQSLQSQLEEQQTELNYLQGQVTLLQEERDQLQSQVWELLQQMETLNQETLHEIGNENQDVELFPFSDLIESLEPIKTINQPELPEEWSQLLEHLPGYEIQVLRAMLEQENPNAIIKKIAESNITMPNLLIDSINERANDTIGELIINPSSEPPTIYQEHITNVKKVIAMHDDIMAIAIRSDPDPRLL